MDFRELILPTNNRRLRSLAWHGDDLVDLAAGTYRYTLEGMITGASASFTYAYDTAYVSPSGKYAAIVVHDGTRGLLIRFEPEGRLTYLREIKRDAYNADYYEYPVLLLGLPDGREVLAHCPEQYNRLEIEDIEEATRLTQQGPEVLPDSLYSRLSVSPRGRYLLSGGGIWHRINYPTIPDQPLTISPPQKEMHIRAGTFLDTEHALLFSSPMEEDYEDDPDRDTLPHPGALKIYHLPTARCKQSIPFEEKTGTMMRIDSEHVVSFYKHPKLIHWPTGKIVHRWPHIDSGTQTTGLVTRFSRQASLALDAPHRRFAVANDDKIHVVLFD